MNLHVKRVEFLTGFLVELCRELRRTVSSKAITCDYRTPHCASVEQTAVSVRYYRQPLVCVSVTCRHIGAIWVKFFGALDLLIEATRRRFVPTPPTRLVNLYRIYNSFLIFIITLLNFIYTYILTKYYNKIKHIHNSGFLFSVLIIKTTKILETKNIYSQS